MDVSPMIIDKSDVNSSTAFPVERYRQDHLIMQNQLDGKPFIYPDIAATGQKPNAILDRLIVLHPGIRQTKRETYRQQDGYCR
jgi:selenocysteine lyase/cysteine desulfurase